MIKKENDKDLDDLKKQIKIVQQKTSYFLGELLNVPVYRVKEGNLGRSYMEKFEEVIVPFKVTGDEVYVLEYNNILCDDKIVLSLMPNDDGWADMTCKLEDALSVQSEMGVTFYFDKLNQFKKHLEMILETLKVKGYIANSKNDEQL